MIISPSFAVNSANKGKTVNIEELIQQTKEAQAKVDVSTLSKKELKKHNKINKKLAKLEKKIEKRKKKGKSIDFSDPVKKWMWFWILGWAVGLILIIVGVAVAAGTLSAGGLGAGGIIAMIGGLAMTFGTVSLIVWLIKGS